MTKREPTMNDEAAGQKTFFAEFGLPPDGFLLQTVEITRWGHDYRFGLKLLNDEAVRCYLIFEDVREVHWESISPETDERDTLLDVMGFEMGEPNHQKRALIYTDVFELLLTYGSMKLVAA